MLISQRNSMQLVQEKTAVIIFSPSLPFALFVFTL
jgi:hypothetical protein